MSSPTILVLGTCDSKLEETLFIQEQILRLNACEAQIMDVGRYPSSNDKITHSPPQIFSQYHESVTDPATTAKDIPSLSRAEYTEYMAAAATHYVKQLCSSGSINGIIAAGGSSGSSLCSAIMRDALPIGFPKLLVSTMMSGDISHYIDNVDITMMYSVTDIAGLNFLSRQILSNAAGAISGMVSAQSSLPSAQGSNKSQSQALRVGITMFGVTTPGVDAIRSLLTEKHGYEVLVFHATGSGGRAMERLCSEGVLDGIIDLTTSEIPDELVGGVLTAGPHRMEAPICRGIPYLVSVGACDMVNFGPRDTVPEKWVNEGRKLYVHNSSVTLMRTTGEENKHIADFIVEKLEGSEKKNRGKIKVVLPTGAISMIAGEGGDFEDRDAGERLFSTIEKGLEGTGIEVIRDERGVNDPEFAERVVDIFMSLMEDHVVLK
ncbi:hypothetical protein MMC10_003374 [Thelotrema lepadinum]|nr:hypothetical protein [Thelotrema lepadinum]